MQRCLHPTEETVDEEYIDGSGDPLSFRPAKENRLVTVSADGLYEYRPPVGLNVKLVKGETSNIIQKSPAKKGNSSHLDEQTIYLKSEPMKDIEDDDDDDDDTYEESESIDVLYETNFEDSVDTDKNSYRKISDTMSSDAASENDSKIMQIKAVRTNKVRLGQTMANKSKTNTSPATKSKTIGEHLSKENATANRSAKSKTNAKGEPKQPKKCEICGNTYMYQHALER